MEPLASYIRNHPQITGHRFSNSTHTISLFADNVILMITDVETSLASIHQTLKVFNSISYYKVNNTKSYILGINIPPKTKHKIEQLYPCTWSTTGIIFLGITFTPKTEELFKANYSIFLDKIHPKLQDLAKTELSWSGRLAAFKIVLLPQFLYLFRTIPIPVLNTFFIKAQSMINRYLWQGMRARCAFSKLIKTRKAGGVGLVVLKDYFIASILAQIKTWFPKAPIPDGRYWKIYNLKVAIFITFFLLANNTPLDMHHFLPPSKHHFMPGELC